MSTVATTHIQLDENGVAWITGANTKVIEVVIEARLSSASSMPINLILRLVNASMIWN